MTPSLASRILLPMKAPRRAGRKTRWCLASFLALSLSAAAAPHEVDFSIAMPEADRVDLVGSFNGWEISDSSRMSNEDGIWHKTLTLDDGTYTYNFKVDEKWLLDWKSSGETRKQRGRSSSILVVPDDLDTFRARQQRAIVTEQTIDIPLFYDRYSENGSSSRPGGYAICPLQTLPPAGDWKLPNFEGPRPLFTVITLGQSEFLAAFDQPPAATSLYKRIYFDRNGNRDLTDDEPLLGDARTYSQSTYFDCSFPPIDLEIDVGGHRMPYGLQLRLSGNLSDPSPIGLEDSETVRNMRVLAMPYCAYLGELALDGIGYRIALGDTTANGSFDERALLEKSGPHFQRFPNARGDSLFIAASDRIVPSDGLMLGRFLAIGNRLFEVQLDIPAGRMTLTPRQDNLGTLELPTPMRLMTLLSTTDSGGLMLVLAGKQTPVPADTFRLMNYRQIKTDDWGDEWELRATGSSDAPPVTVPRNGSASLTVGEPLQAVFSISDGALRQAVARRSLRITLNVIGSLNESITDLRRISGTRTQHKLAKRDTSRPEEPTYRIIKPDGERITSGSFEYG